MYELFANLSREEKAELRKAHQDGKTIELFNTFTLTWTVTRRPGWHGDTAYRVATTGERK